MPAATEGVATVEDLQRQLDEMLGRGQTPVVKASPRLELTEENAKKTFGLSLWEMFSLLAARFGFEAPEDAPKE